MLKEIDTDLLEYPLDAIIHQANCMNTMGSGIAKLIREKYPEAYETDEKTKKGDWNKLGTFSVAFNEKDKKHIYNMYGQYRYGRDKRYTNYEAVFTGLYNICAHIESNNTGIQRLGLPKNMGCTRGGGSWIIVRAIIEEVFGTWNRELYICNYNQQ